MIFRLKNNLSLSVLLLCVAALIGCASSGSQPNGQSNATTGVRLPLPVEIKSGDKVGVAECDEYLAKYEACVKTKVPEPGRSAMQSSINELRKSWINIAVNPETRPNLARDCKQNQETTKQNLSSYACAW